MVGAGVLVLTAALVFCDATTEALLLRKLELDHFPVGQRIALLGCFQQAARDRKIESRRPIVWLGLSHGST